MQELDGSTLSGMARVRRFAQALLELGEEPARAAVRADLWAALRKDALVRERFHRGSPAAIASRSRTIVSSVSRRPTSPSPFFI